MEIKILGTGCAKCNNLEKMVREVVAEIGAEATVTKVSDINEIAGAGVMLTPALMINDDVKAAGKLPSKDDIIKMIKEA